MPIQASHHPRQSAPDMSTGAAASPVSSVVADVVHVASGRIGGIGGRKEARMARHVATLAPTAEPSGFA